jgi:hypothetical protein
MKLLILQSFPSSCHFPSVPFPSTHLRPSFIETAQVSCPYKTAGKPIVSPISIRREARASEQDSSKHSLSRVTLKNASLDVTPCSLVQVYGPSGGIYCLYLQSQSVSRASTHRSACFLLGLVFDPDDGGGTLVRKVAELLSVYTKPHQIFS